MGGWPFPRQIGPDDQQSIVETANTRPETLGRVFTRWSVRKLTDYMRGRFEILRVDLCVRSV